MFMTIKGIAFMVGDNEDGTSDKIHVGESGPMEHMVKTLQYYADNSIRCEFTITITE
jgi:hypothetical protein